MKVPLILEEKDNEWSWSLDVKQIKKYFSKDKPQLMFLCYPNNPTGNYFSEKDIEELIEDFYGIVAIDEAYYEFGGKTFANRLSVYPNIVVIRTFSKIFSLAGLRVGYAIGHEDVIKQLYKVKLPYNVTLFSQIAAVEILREAKFFKKIQGELIEAREQLKIALENIKGLRVYPSSANFFLCELEKPRDLVYEELLRRGILTRRFGDDELLKGTLRFCIGTPKQNEKLISYLNEIMS